MNEKTTHNWPLLAGLRGALALVVLAFHVNKYHLVHNPLSLLSQFNAMAAVWAFLIISGYSIAHSINKEGQHFYWRRVVRIMPVFLTCFVLALIPLLIGGVSLGRARFAPPDSFANLVLNALPLQTVFIYTLNTNGPTWSLGIECCFYALAPLFLKLRPRALFALIGFSILLHANALLFHLPAYAGPVGVYIPLFMAWAWLGGWAIYMYRDNILIRGGAVAAMCIAYSLNYDQSWGRLSFVTIAAVTACLVYQNEIRIPERAKKWLIYLGELSYPLYLVHMPVVCTIETVWPTHTEATPVLIVIFAATLGVYHCIDKPLRHRAKRPAVTHSKNLNIPAISASVNAFE